MYCLICSYDIAMPVTQAPDINRNGNNNNNNRDVAVASCSTAVDVEGYLTPQQLNTYSHSDNQPEKAGKGPKPADRKQVPATNWQADRFPNLAKPSATASYNKETQNVYLSDARRKLRPVS